MMPDDGQDRLAEVPRWMRQIAVAGFAAALLLLIWSAVIEPRWIAEERYPIEIPHLPPEWENARVALIADPQVGLWLSNTGTVGRIVARLVELRPAAVLIAGDFIYNEADASDPENVSEEIRRVTELLRPLATARIPTYAVLGNHDFPVTDAQRARVPNRPARITGALAHVGIRVLADEAVPLPFPDSTTSDLWLVGLSARAAEHHRTEAAFAQVPEAAPRLVLMHNPKTARNLPAGAAPLAMAGHTHGGQVKFPFLLLRRLLGLGKSAPPPISGWMDDPGAPGNRLYINRGIGFSRLPLRFNAPPEITLFTLRAKQR